MYVEESLQLADTPRPRRHAELIIQTALNIDRVSLYINAREIIPVEKKLLIDKLLARRLKGEPIQYIAGWAPFFGREFKVYEGVFIPRFDTELIIERFLAYDNQLPESCETVRVLDLCCGSGAIGLTIAAEISRARVTLVDVSPFVLESCQFNAKSLGVEDKTEILNWDALAAPHRDWTQQFDCIVANPPYIPIDEIVQLHPDVQREPHLALTDGKDGLTFYRHWSKILPELLVPGGWFITEVGDGAATEVSRIMSENLDSIKIYEDLNNTPRVVEGIMPEGIGECGNIYPL